MSALRTFFSQVIDVVFFVYRAKLPQEISNIFLHTYYFTHNERKKEIDCVAGTKRDDDDDDGDDDADDDDKKNERKKERNRQSVMMTMVTMRVIRRRKARNRQSIVLRAPSVSPPPFVLNSPGGQPSKCILT